jgi:hypothetical protein
MKLKTKHKGIISLVILLLFFLLCNYLYDYKTQNDFKKKRINGNVRDIVYVRYNHGYPLLILDKNNYYLSPFWDKIIGQIQIGDSIVKDSGTMVFRLYKKDENGKWNEKINK